MPTTVVFSGGPILPEAVRTALAGLQPGLTVAADSGLVACRRAGLEADVVVGDMDSVPAQVLHSARTVGSRIDSHPSDKDATDLELALDLAMELSVQRFEGWLSATGRNRIVVVASGGGRLDHLVATVALVGASRYAAVEIDAWMGATRVLPVHGFRRIEAARGSTVTLLSLHGTCSGVSTEGLEWPLDDDLLDAAHTRGVSNRVLGEEFEVSVDAGVVTVLIPDPATELDPSGLERTDLPGDPDLPGEREQ